jgi:hypothetical protein
VTEPAPGAVGTALDPPDASAAEQPVGNEPVEHDAEGSAPADRRARLRRLWMEWRRPLTIAVGATLGFRLVVTWVALVSAEGVNFPHVVARHPSALTQILAQWDTGYYLTIAAHGYPGHSAVAAIQDGHRAFYAFGPLYPTLVALAHGVTGLGYITSGEIVSTLGLAVALAALWKLVQLEVGIPAADGACVTLLAWPTAFFLVAGYPESVTLAAATLAFLALRRGHYVAAGLLGAAAAMGKYYLVLLLVPLAMEVWSAPRERESWRRGRDIGWLTPGRVTALRGAAVVGPTIAAFAAFVAYQKANFGEWLAFLHAQAQWHRHLSWPWTSLGHAVSDLVHWRLLDTSTASVVELFDLVTVLLIAVAAVVAFVRVRPSYGVLLALAWCIFTFQTILLSETREVLVLFPFFAALGVWVARHPWRERALLFLFLPCAYFLLERFVTGRFAG